MVKVYIVGDSNYYINAIIDSQQVSNIVDADVILFTGGEDVTPKLYNEIAHRTTCSNLFRDAIEVNVYREALRFSNKLCVGICRGCQFLTVMNGGKLIQNVNHHAINGTHPIELTNGEKIDITSTHHQMAYPFNLPTENYEILGWATPPRSTIYEGSGIYWKPQFKEVEIIYFPKTNCLGIQGHPELMPRNSETVTYINTLITKYLNK